MNCPTIKNKISREAFIAWKKNDWDLVHVHISWPLPSKSALEEVVEAISCNYTVERLDIRDGDIDLLSMLWNNMQPWWNGREEKIT